MTTKDKRVALLSVYDKTGIVEFARELVGMDWQIIASGGTAKKLIENGVMVKDVAELVGGQAILGHRVVTLSREVHAGLLAQDTPQDRAELQKIGVPWIDLLCDDLYPLEEEVGKPGSTRESVIEKTDIGGPTMLRSAAKGRRIVICDSTDRMKVIDWLKSGEPDAKSFINKLAAKAEKIVAEYALTSARYHGEGKYDGLIGEQVSTCSYGENAWQTPAALFKSKNGDALSLSEFKLLAGNPPSYNNFCDLDRLLQTLTHIAAGFDLNAQVLGEQIPLIAVGGKHGNPCGAAMGKEPGKVLENMLRGDPRAIFGGLVMVNFPVNEPEAETLLSYLMPADQRRLLDGIIAPSFSEAAVAMLKRKGDKCRFLANPALQNVNKDSLDKNMRLRYVRGGFLRQPNYTFVLDWNNPDLEKIGKISGGQISDLILAWAIGSTSNSNTVTLTKNGYLIGNGVGQQDRVGGCELAIKRARDAGHETTGAAAYSDSFFPFVDGPQVLAKAGVSAVLTSSGSVKDGEIKKFCAENNLGLVMVPDKLGRGFFGH